MKKLFLLIIFVFSINVSANVSATDACSNLYFKKARNVQVRNIIIGISVTAAYLCPFFIPAVGVVIGAAVGGTIYIPVGGLFVTGSLARAFGSNQFHKMARTLRYAEKYSENGNQHYVFVTRDQFAGKSKADRKYDAYDKKFRDFNNFFGFAYYAVFDKVRYCDFMERTWDEVFINQVAEILNTSTPSLLCPQHPIRDKRIIWTYDTAVDIVANELAIRNEDYLCMEELQRKREKKVNKYTKLYEKVDKLIESNGM